MIAWQRNQTFCEYIRRRRARRRTMLATLYANAANDHSTKLVDRLAKAWRIRGTDDTATA